MISDFDFDCRQPRESVEACAGPTSASPFAGLWSAANEAVASFGHARLAGRENAGRRRRDSRRRTSSVDPLG